MTNPALDNHSEDISMDPAEASSVLDTSMAESSPPHTTVISVRGTGAAPPNGAQILSAGGDKPSLAIHIPNIDNITSNNGGADSETGIESGRTTTTTDNAELKTGGDGGGMTNNKTGSIEPCQMSPNDITSLLGVNNSVS